MSEKIKREAARILLVIGGANLSQSLTFATYTIFLMSRGLSIFEAGLVNMVYHLAVPFFEIPTGAFADIWGRKRSFVVSCFIWVFAMGVYGIARSFWGFVMAEVLAAIATTFASGCIDAHLWDTVSYHAESESSFEPEQVEGLNRNVTAWMMVSTKVIAAIGGLVGAQFGKTNLALPWFLGAAGFLVTAIMAIFLLKEIQPVRQELSYQKDLAGLAMNGWNGIKLVLAEGELKELTTLTFLIGIASMPIFMFWSPHFLKLGGGVAGLGWIWVGIDAAILVGTLVAKEECKKRGDWRTVERGLIVSAIMIGVAGIFRNLAVGLACFFAAEVYLQLVKYGYNVRTQLVISELGFGDPAKESNLRATILSVCSMASGLGGAIGLFFGGLLAQRISIPVAWLFSSVFLVVAFLRVKNWKARQLSCGGLALSPQLVREEEQSS